MNSLDQEPPTNYMKKLSQLLIFRNQRRRSNRFSTEYLGVRRRKWGRYAAEISNPHTKGRHWLGTFDTAEEAALTYDLASISFSGIDRARTNFLYPFWDAPPLTLPPPPPSPPPPPPPPPPTPEFQECNQHCIDVSPFDVETHDDNEESLIIASILESFRQSTSYETL